MAHQRVSKVVKDVVDSGGLYFSRAVSAEGWIFLSSPAVGQSGAIADEATVKAPYQLSSAAYARGQTQYVLERYQDCLKEFGASFSDICQVEEYFPLKRYIDGYLEVNRAQTFLGEIERPDSMMVQIDRLVPEEAVILPMAIAAMPGIHGHKSTLRSGLPFFEEASSEGSLLGSAPVPSEIAIVGPYVFATVAGHDYHSGIHPEARVVEWYWHGHEMRSEAEYVLRALKDKLAAAGTDLSNVVHCTAVMPDIDDLYELDRVWGEVWPTSPPARTVVPIRSLGHPRAEGARGHRNNATRMELQVRSIRPGNGADRDAISTGHDQLGCESEAVKAGPLLWISGLLAGGQEGPLTAPDPMSQSRYIFDRLEEITEAAGTSTDNLLRIRAYLTDTREASVVYTTLKDRVPQNPPCVGIICVPGPLQIPECSMIIDAVAHAP